MVTLDDMSQPIDQILEDYGAIHIGRSAQQQASDSDNHPGPHRGMISWPKKRHDGGDGLGSGATFCTFERQRIAERHGMRVVFHGGNLLRTMLARQCAPMCIIAPLIFSVVSMLFKNACIYRLSKPFELSAEALNERLTERVFVPCSGLRPSSFGWISPISDIEDAPLVHEVMGSMLLCARREDKVVPPSALNEAIVERVKKMEAVEGRPLRSKEKQNLKDNALAELLPRALARSKQIMGYISPNDRLLVIGTGSSTEAEKFIDCLRDSLDTFPVVTPQVKSKPSDVFTHWLMHRKLPDDFALGDQCDLMDPEDTSTVTCRRQDLATSEIRSHIEAGKICTRIGLSWHGDLRFAVDRDLALKQIKVESSNDDTPEDEDPIARLDAAFANMSLEFSRLLPALFEALGGEMAGPE